DGIRDFHVTGVQTCALPISLVGYGRELSYVGELAESWETPDDKTYVFTLREGATYHNGQPVEASHVEFSYKRIAEKQTVWSSRRSEERRVGKEWRTRRYRQQ